MCTSNGILDDWFGIPNPSAVAQQQAQAAAAAEAQRRQRIQQVIDAINQAFNDPAVAQQVQQIVSSQYQNWLADVERAGAQSLRDLKAQMARQGMIGSSAWEEALSRWQQGKQAALAEAEKRKQQLANSIQQSLEAQRNNLIQQAQSGLSLTQAQQLADRALAQSLADAASQNMAANWTEFFTALGKGYTQHAKNQGIKQARAAYQPPPATPAGVAQQAAQLTTQQAAASGY